VAPDVVVARNDEITIDEARDLRPTHVIISPGPCGPERAGVSVNIVREFAGRVPILGVCLGHQCIAAAFGMHVERLESPVHGLATPVHHDGRGLFEGLLTPLHAARYHSLVVPEVELKHGGHGGHGDSEDGWEVSAWMETRAGRVVMGMRRAWALPSPLPPRPGGGGGRVVGAGGGAPAKAPRESVQFHPESFLTEHGVAMMRRFLGDTVAP
jgi:anthranilate synthase/aminodeoxychorismate synthase-like glutamine amidotransferase